MPLKCPDNVETHARALFTIALFTTVLSLKEDIFHFRNSTRSGQPKVILTK
jgi:hypothetical protein